MRARSWPGMAALAALLAAGCEIPQPEEEPVPDFDSRPVIVTPSEDAAVLLVEDHLEFAAAEKLGGGPEGYQDAVQGLARLLGQHGVQARVEAVDESTVSLQQLAHYRSVFVVDCIAMYEHLQEVLTQYVRAGGVLVGIGEVARYNGGWQKDWPFGKLFGLSSRVCDPWGTGVTWDGFLYQGAQRVTDDPLLDGLGARILWGTNATVAWATAPAGAKVLAVFPEYVVRFTESADPKTVKVPIPALTVRQEERGVAVYCATLPSGHKPGGWEAASDAGRVLANALKYAPKTLILPPDLPVVTVGRNQAAYEPDWPKSIVVRVMTEDQETPRIQGTYTLYDDSNHVLRKGRLERWPEQLWKSQFLIADLTDITAPGAYRVDIDLPQTGNRIMARLRVAERVLVNEIMPTQIEFLRGMRCGEKCHMSDPVTGGYHDATGDWAVRMWSMPHLVWALARYAEARPADAAAREELAWAVEWCLKMQDRDGAAFAGVRPPDDNSPHHLRPWQDRTARELETRYSFEYTATYAAALARAAKALGGPDDPFAAKALDAARRAFSRLQKNDVTRTAELGNRAWAAMELYGLTRDEVHLDSARTDIVPILERQLARGRVADGDIYGNFFADSSKSGFSPQQWKVFHSIGIYLGQIELARVLPADSRLRGRIEKSLADFTEGYLLRMSGLSPYQQMASALEPTPDGEFKVYFFSHRKSWVLNHGLNCDMFAMATIALERAKDTGDKRLRDMAARQVNWLLGCNPLGYSMITGIGQSEAPLIKHAVGTGHIRGGIPNGIIGLGKLNLPAWGTSWDSREYWLPHNAYLISTIALMTEDYKTLDP